MRALIGISISREWNETEFLQQLATIIIPSGWHISYGWLCQFTAAERHNIAVLAAKAYDRLLFLDTDQIYPVDYYLKMLEHDEPIVSALNTARYYPYDLCVFNIKDTQKVINEEGKEVSVPLFQALQQDELMAIDRECFLCDMTGTGALMIDPKILEDIPKPYFKDIYGEDGHRILCDDFYFGYKLYQANHKVLIDTRIITGHIVKTIVKPYNALDLRRAWEKMNSGYGYWKDGLDPSIVVK